MRSHSQTLGPPRGAATERRVLDAFVDRYERPSRHPLPCRRRNASRDDRDTCDSPKMLFASLRLTVVDSALDISQFRDVQEILWSPGTRFHRDEIIDRRNIERSVGQG